MPTSMFGSSSRERLWLVGGVVAALFVTLVGWLFFISPQRAQTADVNGQAASVQVQNDGLRTKIKELWNESKKMDEVTASLTAAKQALPSTSGVPDFLRTLQSLGSQTGADVVTLTVGAPTDVTAVAAGSTAAPSASPTESAAPAAPTTAPGTGVYALSISAQVNGSPDQLNRFLDKLQAVQPRAVLITQLTEGSGDGTTGSGTSLQLTMAAFVAPSSQAENSQLSQAAGS